MHTAARPSADMQEAVAFAQSYYNQAYLTILLTSHWVSVLSSLKLTSSQALRPFASDTTMQQRVAKVVDVMMEYNGLSYEARMAVIRVALNNPRSILSAEVRRPSRLTRDERLQLSQDKSSASPQPSSERAEPPHKKPWRD